MKNKIIYETSYDYKTKKITTKIKQDKYNLLKLEKKFLFLSHE